MPGRRPVWTELLAAVPGDPVTALLRRRAALLAWPAAGRVPAAARRGSRAGGSARAELARGAGGHLVAARRPASPGGAAGALVSTPLVAGAGRRLRGARPRGRLAGRAGVAARDEADLLALADGLGGLGAELRAGRSPATAVARGRGVRAGAGSARALIGAARDGPAGPTSPVGRPGAGGAGPHRGGCGSAGATGCSLAAVSAAVEDDLRARHRQAAGAALRDGGAAGQRGPARRASRCWGWRWAAGWAPTRGAC